MSIIAHPSNNHEENALKAFMKALKIKFEVSDYDPEFVAKINQSEKEIEQGNFKKVKKEDINNFLGL